MSDRASTVTSRLSQLTSTMPPPSPGPSSSNASLLSFLTQSLQTFTSSKSRFSILYTHPPVRPPPPSSLPHLRRVYILDSSFNPPSRAHLAIAKDALLSARKAGYLGDSRLLLLLAVKNADKAPKPAEFGDRLGMMVVMARDLVGEVGDEAEARRDGGAATQTITNAESARGSGTGAAGLMIDIGVTSEPYFIDKATAIDESGVYGEAGKVEQIHLTGFDTLVRIFDQKYYGDSGLQVLQPFLEKHRIRAVIRPDEKGEEGGKKGESAWGGMQEQTGWLEDFRRGRREKEGLRREWAERVELVEVEGGKGVSSTKAREAVKAGRWEEVEQLLGTEVSNWVREGGLYREDG